MGEVAPGLEDHEPEQVPVSTRLLKQVRDELRPVNPDLADAVAEEITAARVARLDQFMGSLPAGFDTDQEAEQFAAEVVREHRRGVTPHRG